MDTPGQAVVTTDGLPSLLDALRQRGYRVVGPTVPDQAIVYDDIVSIDDLPRGWTDGRMSRRAGIIVSSIAMTKRCSVTPSDRIHGRSFCTRRCCGAFGAPNMMRRASA